MKTAPETLRALRQSTAELLANALCDLFPGTQLVGSAITDIGFHYDVVLPKKIDASALPMIEERMRFIAQQNPSIKVLDMVASNATAFLLHHGQQLKAEMIIDSEQDFVQLFQMGSFVDTYDQPCFDCISGIKAFKIQSLSFFENPTRSLKISRFVGTAFVDTTSLKRFLKRFDEAQKHDHRTIGQEMKLYIPLEESGCWIWQPKGMVLRQIVAATVANDTSLLPIKLPLLAPANPNEPLVATAKFNQSRLAIGADPSPLFAQLFTPTSFLQLPIRYQTTLQQGDKTDLSQLWGLLQSRSDELNWTQIFCTEGQLQEELISSLQFIDQIIKIFRLEQQWILCTTPPTPFKNKGLWAEAVESLESAMRHLNLDYALDKQAETLYGPKIAIKWTDAIGRQWQGPFVGLDVTHPEKLNLRYLDQNQHWSRPAVVMRSILGPLDRLVAILIEQSSGSLPFWLAPEQVRLIAVNADNAVYATEIKRELEAHGLRVHVDNAIRPLGERVHAAEIERIPHIAIIGEREQKQGVISVRAHDKGTTKRNITAQMWLTELLEELAADKKMLANNKDTEASR
ncbi:MAG: hypothetical protein H0X51_09660 [Parachlamydiaceae bacterium]|nr:hypothetical protein [Parachlamydiaceae bacterium]